MRYILLAITSIIFMGASSCRTAPPALDLAFYRADSIENAIISDRLNDKISCQDIRIENYACLSYDQIKLIYQTMLRCQKWDKSGTRSINQQEINQIMEFVK